MFSSTIQILKVDTPEEKVSPKDGSRYTIRTAQCALLDDGGTLLKVGRLRIPESLKDKVKEGVFRAGFALDVASWGQNKGDIMTVLTDLSSMPVKAKS